MTLDDGINADEVYFNRYHRNGSEEPDTYDWTNESERKIAERIIELSECHFSVVVSWFCLKNNYINLIKRRNMCRNYT